MNEKSINSVIQVCEDLYKTIFDNSLDGIFITNPDGTILAANQAACEIFGMNEAELIQAGRNGTVDTTDPRLKNVLEERDKIGKYKGELNHRRKDGTVFPCEISSALFKDKNGLTKNVMIIRDITERKQAEESLFNTYKKLHSQSEELNDLNEDLQCQLEEIQEVNYALWESEQKLQDIIDGSTGTIFVKDIIGRYILINKKLEEQLGLTREEIKGKNDYDIYSPEWAEYYRLHDLEVIEKGIPKQIEEMAELNDGLHIFLANRFLLYDSIGKPYALCCIASDITERKKVEEALKKSYDTLEEKVKDRTTDLEKAYNSLKESEKSLAEAQRIAHVGNWDWNIVTDKLYWSDEIYRMFGQEPQEFGVNYKAFISNVHPDDREFVNNAVLEALKNITPYYIDHRVKWANGEERIVHEQGEVIFDEENNPVRMIGTVQDITDRKKAEEALARIEIARKQEIHHRIKNNLQVISSMLDLQAEQFRDKECIKDSEVLEAFRESQDRVISMALIHEELYKGGEFETLNFSSYIKKLAENLLQTYCIGNNNISLKLNLAESAFFDMDTTVPLGMIVNELVTNSFKHAFPDSSKGEIRIKLRREENVECITNINEDCTTFILIVSDNGVSIPNDLYIENLDTLGMQLVTSLIDQLDGEFELKRDNGTEFIIRFKVKESNYHLYETAPK